MKDNKSPGIDDLTSDIIKAGGEEAVVQFTKLYNQILQSKIKKIPQRWKEAKIIRTQKGRQSGHQELTTYKPAFSCVQDIHKNNPKQTERYLGSKSTSGASRIQRELLNNRPFTSSKSTYRKIKGIAT
jgi:hypothetical protein